MFISCLVRSSETRYAANLYTCSSIETDQHIAIKSFFHRFGGSRGPALLNFVFNFELGSHRLPKNSKAYFRYYNYITSRVLKLKNENGNGNGKAFGYQRFLHTFAKYVACISLPHVPTKSPFENGKEDQNLKSN